MSDCVIVGCGRPTKELACRSCIDKLLYELRQVAELVRELAVTHARLDHIAAEQFGRSAETALVWREHASECLYVLRNTLSTWARDLWETNGSGALEVADNPVAVAAWMERHPTWLALHPAIDELLDEVAYAIRQARHAIDQPQDTRIFLGRCDLGLPENPACDRELYAYRSQEEVVCPSCEASWDVDERREWLLAQAEHETATSEVLAGLLTRLGVPTQPRDIQAAARRGELDNVGIDSHTKRRRYRVGAVLDALLPGRPKEGTAA